MVQFNGTEKSCSTAWDLPLRRFESVKHSKPKNLNKEPKNLTSGGLDDRNDVCNRLFNDYLDREKRAKERTELEKKEVSDKALGNGEGLASGKPNPVLAAEKERQRHQQIQQEHVTLSHGMSIQRELEAERGVYLKGNAMRLYPPLQTIDRELEPYYEELKRVGDYKRNIASITTLISSQEPENLRSFLYKIYECRDTQKAILSQFFDCHAYDDFIQKQMTVEVLEDVLNVVDRILDEKDEVELKRVIEKSTPSPETGGQLLNKQRWMETANLRDEILEEAFNRLSSMGYFEDLGAQRRELTSEKNNLMLSLLHLLTRCDIDLRALFSEYRLGKLHIRGYDPTAVESVKSHEWYANLGSTTSLRNNMKIRNSIKKVIEDVKSIIRRELEVPDLDKDPNRRLLEEVLRHKSKVEMEGEHGEEEERDEGDELSKDSSRHTFNYSGENRFAA